MLCLEVMTYLGKEESSGVQLLPITRVTPKLGPSRCFPLCEAQALSRAQNTFYIFTRQNISLELPPVTGL